MHPGRPRQGKEIIPASRRLGSKDKIVQVEVKNRQMLSGRVPGCFLDGHISVGHFLDGQVVGRAL